MQHIHLTGSNVIGTVVYRIIKQALSYQAHLIRLMSILSVLMASFMYRTSKYLKTDFALELKDLQNIWTL